MGMLEGKAAIVTGSARGIGRATAELLCAQGARVLVNDLDADLAAEAAAEIDGDDRGLRRRPDAGRRVRRPRPDRGLRFGQLDIVVNNAGYTWDGIAHRMSDQQFRAMLEIHTVVPFKVLRAAAPYLRDPAKQEREEGREVFRKVVNVTSISGTQGNVGQINYSAGKAGLVGITKTLAREWGPFRVNVNAVAFGFVETRLTASVDESTERFAVGAVEVPLGIRGRCARARPASSRWDGARRLWRPRGPSSSSARPGRTSSRGRCSPSTAARRPG